MAHSPMPAATATNSAPSRSRRREKPSSGSSRLVCTVAAFPVASTSAASANPHTQAATVRATDRRTRVRGGALGTSYRGGQAKQGRGHQKIGPHLPDRPRSAAMMASGSGGQPGISTSTGTTSATAPATP